MFLEPNVGKKGWIEVICGSMFSGKTEELIRRLKRAQIANQSVEIYKPTMDTRYNKQEIVSHNSNSILSIPIDNAEEILLRVSDVDVIGIDEAQFFDSTLPKVCEQLSLRGIRVIAAGLDMDYSGMPFGPIPQLLCKADYITKLHAICMRCGGLATHSYRKVSTESQILLGEKEAYEPRCRHCYNKKG